jgi:hypothetical protein
LKKRENAGSWIIVFKNADEMLHPRGTFCSHCICCVGFRNDEKLKLLLNYFK